MLSPTEGRSSDFQFSLPGGTGKAEAQWVWGPGSVSPSLLLCSLVQGEHQASLDSRARKQTPRPPNPRKELQSHHKDLETGKSKRFHCCLQATSDTTEGSRPIPTVPPVCPGGGGKRCYRLRRGSGGNALGSADPNPDFLRLRSAAS